MFTLLISLIIIFSALLVVLILVQNPKGGGISGEFSSSGATQMFGVQKTLHECKVCDKTFKYKCFLLEHEKTDKHIANYYKSTLNILHKLAS